MAIDTSLVGMSSGATTFEYGWKDVVLYALGIGAKVDELDYLYEGRGPKVYPSFAVVPTLVPMAALLGKSGGNLATVVHGGQKVVIHAPIPPEGRLETTATVRAVHDLKKFASVVIDTVTKDARSGSALFDTTWSIIFRGAGGFGGPPPPREEAAGSPPPAGQAPDFSIAETTSKEQALLYRLNGDYNPLHADPDFASMVGFAAGPILHGLCTFGFMARAIVRGACEGDATRLKVFEAQFRKPVWPGDTVVTDGWRLDSRRYAIGVGVRERGETVISGGLALIG